MTIQTIKPTVVRRRLPEIGRLRLGEARADPKRPGRPLTRFRFTSSARANVEAVAKAHGGTVMAWGDQWQVIVAREVLPVIIPPENACSSMFELWAGPRLIRRCDGETCQRLEETPEGAEEFEEPCLCKPQKRECKPVTRLNVILQGVEVFGVALLQGHGWNMAAEIPGIVDVLMEIAKSSVYVPASLRIEARTQVKGKVTRRFLVPKLEIRANLAELALPALETALLKSPPLAANARRLIEENTAPSDA